VLPFDVPDTPLSSSPVLALQGVLAAYGVTVDAERLERECGVHEGLASIDEVERVATMYGVPARQTVAPAEHVLASSARLPVIAIQSGAGDALSFLLLWRIEQGEVQVLTADGVEWRSCRDVEARLHHAELDLQASAIVDYLRSEAFLPFLARRLRQLGLQETETRRLLEEAQREPSWRDIAALDAAARHMATKRVADVTAAVRAAFASARDDGKRRIPREAFFAVEAPRGVQGEERISVRATVIVEVFP
jgi:hypothetical protein